MNGIFLTHCGQVRGHNEDAGGIFKNKDGQLIAIIADGMGGHLAGDVASMLAIENMKTKWEETDRKTDKQHIESWLQEVITDTNSQIYQKSKENSNLEGMGTTLVAAVISRDFVTIAHVGDSRCYLADQEKLQQVTEDHSFVNELVKRGEISEDDAEVHPRKNIILRALGSEPEVETDIKTISWSPGNCLLLCSDGLSDKVNQQELEQFILTDREISQIGNELIDVANERGGEDNISLILMTYDGSNGEAGEPA